MTPTATATDTAYQEWLLRAMLSIPSVSGEEKAVASFLADQMRILGMTSWVDEVGNVHGITGPQDAPTIILLGHIDTVPGQVPVCLIGDLLYGRGAVDAKGPMAAMTCAAARTANVRVHVIGAVGEEVAGSRGARHVLRTVQRPDAVVIGEPSGWDGVCIGYKGRVGVGYEITCPMLHTSSPEPTAAEYVLRFSRMILEYLRSVSPENVDPVSFDAAHGALVRLEGGLRYAETFLTCRVPEGFDFAAFERVVRAFPHTRVWFDETVPATRRPRHDLVASQLRAAIIAHGGSPTIKLKAGTSDMNTVSGWGVPIASYGPGDAHLDHTDDEHLALSELHRAIDVLSLALIRIGERLVTRQGPKDDLTRRRL